MKLSTRSRYGARVMVDLAQHSGQGPIPANDISRRQDISVKYIEQLVIPLKKAQFIKSVRGTKGGHMLAVPRRDITLGQIIRLLEKDVGAVPRSSVPIDSELVEQCCTRHIWEKALGAFYGVLDAVTLDDLTHPKGLAEK